MPSKKPLREIIFDNLKSDIINRHINAGEKLSEASLAKKYKVSRTPIREALYQLAKEGFVEHTPNIGATVKKISIRKVGELYEISSILESHAVEIATGSHLRTEDLAQLKDLQEQMEVHYQNGHYDLYEDTNRVIHDLFLKRCGNRSLLTLALDTRRKMYMMSTHGLPLDMHILSYIEHHRQILSAVLKGDAGEAGALMKSHILSVARNLISHKRYSLNF